jgi:CDP-diacylglycerol--glycerol-3-phosphate 3-phosphatidyltransferase/cardiolipin synthase
MKGSMLTLPNLLTLSRIVTVPVLVWLLWWPQWSAGYVAAYAVYCLMGITDYFDGYLARAQGAVSAGRVSRSYRRQDHGGGGDSGAHRQGRDRGVHVVAALVILLREIAVSGLREFLAGLKISVPVSQMAKWKTTLQIIALGSLILIPAVPHWHVPVVGLGGWLVQPLCGGGDHAVGAAALTLITGWDYLRVGLKHMD